MSDARSKLLLLVEDEVQLCDVLSEALQNEGFELVVARNGAAAIVMLQRYRRGLGGLITDIDLGSALDGWSIATAARVLRPNLPVFYMSGASAQDWPTKGVVDSLMIGKPFALERLTAAVKVALQPSAGA
jgi:DNA-binding response OmpR family regulator